MITKWQRFAKDHPPRRQRDGHPGGLRALRGGQRMEQFEALRRADRVVAGRPPGGCRLRRPLVASQPPPYRRRGDRLLRQHRHRGGLSDQTAAARTGDDRAVPAGHPNQPGDRAHRPLRSLGAGGAHGRPRRPLRPPVVLPHGRTRLLAAGAGRLGHHGPAARRLPGSRPRARRTRRAHPRRTGAAPGRRGAHVRIARELHDVVAHHLALADALAGAAAHLARSRPDQTRRILGDLADTTSSALRELKSVRWRR
ncbi:histidine kinase [Streptomyces sp. NPDC007095]|uniref:histidine kinase n=1 Tax=Streptomyces sp. NPDC007095 TaxID=3154482 RepID=UPI0033C0F2A2